MGVAPRKFSTYGGPKFSSSHLDAYKKRSRQWYSTYTGMMRVSGLAWSVTDDTAYLHLFIHFLASWFSFCKNLRKGELICIAAPCWVRRGVAPAPPPLPDPAVTLVKDTTSLSQGSHSPWKFWKVLEENLSWKVMEKSWNSAENQVVLEIGLSAKKSHWKSFEFSVAWMLVMLNIVQCAVSAPITWLWQHFSF